MLNLTRKDWRFCLRWTVATAIALSLCGLLGPVGFMVGPLTLAIAQGVALKGYWGRAIFWGFGMVVGGHTAWVALALGLLAQAPVSLAIVMSSAVLGLAQAFVLRGASQVWRWWPLVTIVILQVSIGWFVPLVLNAAVYGSQRPMWQWITLTTLTGLIGGSLTSIALAWVLKQPPRFSQIR
ncbi:MAG: hypothetical protein F6K42_14405 [Leptolyngbya sp. SIO1D8]|nr:hypothetical protein [Leptolyngbya sp. SIO1D8]